MTESTTPRTDALIEAHGLTMTAELLEDRGYRHPAKWRVTLKAKNGQEFSTEYTMGAAFRELPPKPWANAATRARTARLVTSAGSRSIREAELLSRTVPTAPDLPTALYCLASDAECVRHGQSLTEFGEELGYEKLGEGVAAYEGCTANWHGLLRLGIDPEALSEATREDDNA